MEEHVAIYIDNNKQLDSFDRMYFSWNNSSMDFQIDNLVTLNEEIIGKKILQWEVKSIHDVAGSSPDSLILMYAIHRDLDVISALKKKIFEETGYPMDHIISLDGIIQIPENANIGTFIVDSSIPRNCYIDVHYCIRNNLLRGSNDLENKFLNSQHRPMIKWLHYFDIYDRHLNQFKNKKVKILEIGVYKGGSLDLWRDYLGPDATIVGIDIDKKCLAFNEQSGFVEIGSQDDPSFLINLSEKYGPFDVVIDDGGHRMNQQKTSFNTLFPLLNIGGIYICEDCHTSYFAREFKGGYKKKSTFIEYAKSLIDVVNYHFIVDDRKNLKKLVKGHSSISNFFYRRNIHEDAIKSITFYDSVVVFERGKMGKCVEIKI